MRWLFTYRICTTLSRAVVEMELWRDLVNKQSGQDGGDYCGRGQERSWRGGMTQLLRCIKPQSRSPLRIISIKISNKVRSLKVHQNALLPNPLCSLPGWGVSSGSCAFLQWIRSSNFICSFHQLHQDLFKHCTRSNNGCYKEWHRECQLHWLKLYRCGTNH